MKPLFKCLAADDEEDMMFVSLSILLKKMEMKIPPLNAEPENYHRYR